jgi:hypothetical protein
MKMEELARKSHEAARVRAYQTHPDVIALRIEQVRAWSARIIWAGVVLGLAFTMTNVQQFAANGAPTGSLPWLSAWLLDPMVSLVLIGVLVAEQVTSRWELDTPVWARRTKWFALSATYAMNTWRAWSQLSPSGIVLHSVPPLLVFTAVEGGPAIRETLTKAVARSLLATTAPGTLVDTAGPVVNGAVTALVNLAGVVGQVTATGVHEPVHDVVHQPAPGSVHEPTPAPVREPRSRRSGTSRKAKAGKGSRGGRVLFADYLAMAREQRPVDLAKVTPVWCRQVTGCSSGTSVKLAAVLNAETPDTPDVVPDPSGDPFTITTPTITSDTAPESVAADRESEAA